MRRCAGMIVALMVLAAAPALAQAPTLKKQKDPVLHQYLAEEFGQLNAKLTQLAERLAALEAELAQLKQAQGEQSNEQRNTQTMLKAADATVTSLRVTTQQDLLALKTDLGELRKDVLAIQETLKKEEQSAASATEGYITDVKPSEVRINLGSGAGIKLGMRLNVYRSTDPKLHLGVVEVVEVVDANNSRAKIVVGKPNSKFEFADIVRPE